MQEKFVHSGVVHGPARLACVVALTLLGCAGQILEQGPSDETDVTGPEGVGPDASNPVALTAEVLARRLTTEEYNRTLEDLLGDESNPGTVLPAAPRSPFDNDYTGQTASATLIEAVELLAGEASERLLADEARRDDIVGCTPEIEGARTCFARFVTRFGRRAFRGSLSETEVEPYVAVLDESDFYASVDIVVRAILQDPRFLYRIEVGTEVEDEPGLFRLTGPEMASRLSYLLWGSMPNDSLLDLAESGGLDSESQVVAVATEMLDHPRTRARMVRYHSMWLGYERAASEMSEALAEESAALINRVILEDRSPWYELFTASETFIDENLAEHYGLPAPLSGEAEWVDYGESGRAGILSHGSFLTIGSSSEDTNPTQRGQAIRQRMLCQVIELPSSASELMMADVDATPSEDECRQPWLEANHASGACAGCHNLMDPIGFGLENFDQLGRYRTHEVDKPDCTLSGDGELAPLGEFNGPGELGELLTSSEQFDRCAFETLYTFVIGRPELHARDYHFVDELLMQTDAGTARFDELLLSIVGHPAFHHRRESTEAGDTP